MKQHATLLIIGLGCFLFATSGCADFQYTSNQIALDCNYGMIAGFFGNPAAGLLGCAAGVTVHTIGAIESRHNSLLEPTTAEPTVVRWDATYAPLPTIGDTPAQPESPLVPSPPPTPHNNPSKGDTSAP